MHQGPCRRLIDPRLGREDLHLVGQGAHLHVAVAEPDVAVLVAPGERVLHPVLVVALGVVLVDRKSTRLNSSHANISYAVFCLKKKNTSSIGRRHIIRTTLTSTTGATS